MPQPKKKAQPNKPIKANLTRNDELGVTYNIKPGLSAIRYYRMEIPSRAIESLDLGHTFLNGRDGDDGEMGYNTLMGSDIGVYWRPMGDDLYEWFNRFSQMPPKKNKKEGSIIYPPLLICDSDDAVDWTHPLNGAYNCLGVRDDQGEMLKPGDSVMIQYDGKEQVLWKDKVTEGQGNRVFDIARNQETIGFHYDAARLAGGVTVTNEFLAQIYRDQDVEDVYVFPNSVIPEDWDYPKLAPRENPDEIRILWEGGSSHVESWTSIREPLCDFLRGNPNCKLVVFGDLFGWMSTEIDPKQFELHSWIDYGGYKIKRSLMDADINLAPLIEGAFYEAKSAIRYYEGALGPFPEVTLAANVGPYKEIIDGETGMLYNDGHEFVQKLHELVHNPDLRKQLGQNAQKWVLANRHYEKTVPGLIEFYKHLLSKQKQDYLKP